MNNFDIQHEYMVRNSKQTKPDVPKLVKNTTVNKWNDPIEVCADQVFSERKATLEYLLWTNDAVVAPLPPLMLDHPYSSAAGSIQGEQTLRLSLKHTLYRDDNKSFFDILEVALRGTNYEASINPFKRNGNGRGSYKSLIAQHAVKDKLVKILWYAKTYVNERKWDVTTSYLMQSQIEKFREFYVEIENASEHVTGQVPNTCTRVQSLLDSIEGCTDTNIFARVAEMSNKANGMQLI